MQFSSLRVSALLAFIQWADLVSTLELGSDQTNLGHAGVPRLVRRPEKNAMTPQDMQILFKDQSQDGYLPQQFRHADDLLDDYRTRLAQASGPLSEDVLAHLPNDESCLVFDVGANVGTFTDQVTSKKPGCTVIAFEPVEELASYMIDRHKNNPKVVIEDLAVSDISGQKILYKSSKDLQASSLQKDSPDQKPEKVTATSLADYSRVHELTKQSVHAIKVDVAGGEWRVLHGMRSLIEGQTHFKPIIIMRTGSGKAESLERKQEASEIEYLFDNGYKRMTYSLGDTHDLILMPVSPWSNASWYSPVMPLKPVARILKTPSAKMWAMIRVWCIVVFVAVLLMSGVWAAVKKQRNSVGS